MTALISVWGKHQSYPVHVNIEGKQRFYRKFSVTFDAQAGELTFKGINGHGVTEKCLKVMP